MNTRYFEYVLEVYKQQSISKAAEKLFLSQPTLSQHIQKIEKDIGTDLFNRTTSPITLTYAGERFIHYATQMLQLEHQLEQEINDIKNSYIGRVTIGIPSLLGTSILPDSLPIYNKTFSNIKILLIEENAKALEELVLQNKVDCIITNLPLQNTCLEYEILQLDQILLAIPENLLPQNFPLATEPGSIHYMSERININELKDKPFLLLKKGQRVRQIADNLFDRNQIHPSVALESINIHLLYQLATIGMGITLLPLNLLKKYASQTNTLNFSYPLYLFSLDASISNYSLIIAYKSYRELSIPTKELLKIIKKNHENH